MVLCKLVLQTLDSFKSLRALLTADTATAGKDEAGPRNERFARLKQLCPPFGSCMWLEGGRTSQSCSERCISRGAGHGSSS